LGEIYKAWFSIFKLISELVDFHTEKLAATIKIFGCRGFFCQLAKTGLTSGSLGGFGAFGVHGFMRKKLKIDY
jgi:hypothetical protein